MMFFIPKEKHVEYNLACLCASESSLSLTASI